MALPSWLWSSKRRLDGELERKRGPLLTDPKTEMNYNILYYTPNPTTRNLNSWLLRSVKRGLISLVAYRVLSWGLVSAIFLLIPGLKEV